jgi:hypothetical protein
MKNNEKDRLKEFVDQHKSTMDIHDAPEMDWKFVVKTSNKKEEKVIRLTTVLRWAVASVVIIIAGNVLFWVYNSKSLSVVQAKADEITPIELFQVSDEIAEIEFYYSSQIKDALVQVEDLGYSDELKTQLNLLDTEYMNLKKELNNNLDNELVIYQMIENYRLKLELLENAIRNISTDDQIVENNEIHENEKYTVYY